MVTTVQRQELDQMAASIKAELDQISAGVRTTLEAANRAGNLMFQAKEIVQDARAISWRSYCRNSLSIGTRQADNYIRIFENWDKIEAYMEENPKKVPTLGIKWAVRFLATPTPERRRPSSTTPAIERKVKALMRRFEITAEITDMLAFLDTLGVTEDTILGVR